ncbi:hypothetical protein ACSNOI_30205 [Actinomadura kijaniata]|uniref:hypothetical protein n=1 Tax=Actinomadura kijaniata TaxID=46161 RepID=UPI003F1E1ABF
METPSVPGRGSDRIKQGAGKMTDRATQTTQNAAGTAAGTATGATSAAGRTAGAAGRGVEKGVRTGAGTVAALPKQAMRLTKLLSLQKLLRAAPAVAAAGVAVVVARRVMKRR